MKNYQITIGYKAVVCINVNASDEKEAKDIAVKMFTEKKDEIYRNGIELHDDNFNVGGILDMDATWNMLL